MNLGDKELIWICLSPKVGNCWGTHKHKPSNRSATKDHLSGRLIVSKPIYSVKESQIFMLSYLNYQLTNYLIISGKSLIRQPNSDLIYD